MAIKNDDGDHARALRSIHQVATPTKRMKFGFDVGGRLLLVPACFIFYQKKIKKNRMGMG